MSECLYFGCWDRAGHNLHDAKGDSVREHPVAGSFGSKLDGPFTPHRASGPEGIVRLTHLGGYTILSFSDRTIDSRGGSHATFIMEGELPYEDAMACARRTFGFVFARIEARGISLVEEQRVGAGAGTPGGETT